MEFRVSRHAEFEMERRAIPLALVRSVVEAPEQRIRDGWRVEQWIYQSLVVFDDGKKHLVKVVVAEEHRPPLVVTVCRTSKIEKYWRAE